MVTDNPPYFFSETQTERTQLSKRQRARNFTLKDLDWFDSVYLATDALRRAQTVPMHVQTLQLNVPGQPAIELAGAFVMSPAPEGELFSTRPFAAWKSCKAMTHSRRNWGRGSKTRRSAKGCSITFPSPSSTS